VPIAGLRKLGCGFSKAELVAVKGSDEVIVPW
jgi:hypothetical protein